MAQSITTEHYRTLEGLPQELIELNLKVLAFADALPIAHPLLEELVAKTNDLLEKTPEFYPEKNAVRAQQIKRRITSLLEGNVFDEKQYVRSWFVATHLVYEEMYSLVASNEVEYSVTERETETLPRPAASSYSADEDSNATTEFV